MGDLIPGQALIYEQVDGVVFARYRDKPDTPRWVVGGDPAGMSRLQGELFTWSEWQDMANLALTNITLRKQMSKLRDLYLIIKDDK